MTSEAHPSIRIKHPPIKQLPKDNLSPKEFVKKYPLPRVARIYDAQNEMDSGDLKTHIDLQQPFLLYKSYSSVKVHARSLDDETGSLKEVGPTVAIPEDYTGWFSLVLDDGRNQTKSYSSIEQIANAHVPAFLVRNDTLAYKLQDIQSAGGKLNYSKTTVKTGHVLKLLGIYEDLYSRFRRESSGNRSHDVNEKSFKYAQCLNYKGEVLYLPFTAKGLFYPTANAKSLRNKECVYLMSHLLKFIEFPTAVRLVCGFLPKVPFNFTGLLKLICAKQEEIILACTLVKERNVMLEMDMRSGFTLCVTSDEDRIVNSEICQSALTFCSDEAEIWKRQMKVMHFIYPNTNKTPSDQKKADDLQKISKRSSTTSQQLFALDDTTRLETQSVCISMIFDDMDEDESRFLEMKHPPIVKQMPTVTAQISKMRDSGVVSVPERDRNRPSRFWTLKHLRKLMNFGSENSGTGFGVLRSHRGINDWVNDGSENANDEFIAGTPKDYLQKVPKDLNARIFTEEKNKFDSTDVLQSHLLPETSS